MALLKECENIVRCRCYKHGTPKGVGLKVSTSINISLLRSEDDFLITIKADVVDAHFAGFNTIYYLLKVLVFDLQSITD